MYWWLLLANLVEKVVSREVAGSPYREELNKGILRMQEVGNMHCDALQCIVNGTMETLAKKWIGLQGSQCPAHQLWHRLQ